MSLIPTIYSSTDPGAPQLSGTPGSLISVLRAVLVNGYGTAPNDRPGLGWTEEFTGTNKAVFRNSPASGSGYHLRVVDDGSSEVGGSARLASVRGFSAMSDIDTGTDPTPTIAQSSTGPQWAKSSHLSSDVRTWWAIGNELCFYLVVAMYQGNPISNGPIYFAGDFISDKPGDLHNFGVSHVSTTGYSGSQLYISRLFNFLDSLNGIPANSSCSLFFARASSGIPGSVPSYNIGTMCRSQNEYGGSNSIDYPDPVSGGLLFDLAHISEGARLRRGRFPGVYVPLHNRPFADLEQLTEPDGLPESTVLLAKSFRSQNQISTSSDGQVLFDTVNPWH